MKRLLYSAAFWCVERRTAHLLGWHNDACRGAMECWDPLGRDLEFRFGRRWWRWVR